jgi:DNA invertase Pin-like site-specific DNA recombinase
MFQMMGVVAEFERAMIAERVRTGLARARGVNALRHSLSNASRLSRPLVPLKP